MRVLHVAAVLASCGMPMPAIAQDEATWASRLDYTLNESRDKPIICKQGDIERHAGQTLAQVFAEKWPVQPEPLPGSERVQAQATRAIRPRGAMRGMPVQPGIVVFAVLVDENGDDTGLENELEILVQNLNEVIKKNESRSLELEMEEKGEIEIGLDKVLDDIAGKENLDKFIAETEDFLDLIVLARIKVDSPII